jgi:2,3-bisphosphoglycerate-dependent phosphoglycerate mutase
MTAVYLLRHPETTWNRAKRYQGRLDSPLSRDGENQVRVLVRGCSGAHLDAVVTSPLARARALAQALAEATGASLRFDQRLTEMAQGPWEGLHLDEIRASHRELYHLWYTHPERVCFPGGENLTSVRIRSQAVLHEIFSAYPGGQVAVVTHAVVARVIVLCALHLPAANLHRMTISNCSVTTLCGSDSPGMLLSLNCTDTLYGSPFASAAAHDCATMEPRRATT